MNRRIIPTVIGDEQAESVLETTAEGNRTLGVLLPGIGYTCDRPLLYYTGRLLQEHGCDLLRVRYGSIPGDGTAINDVSASVLETIREALSPSHIEIILVGKSYGTVVAGRLMSRLSRSCRVRMLLYTPVRATLSYMNGSGYLAFSGTKDDHLTAGDIDRWFGDNDPRIVSYDGANHSLEIPKDTFSSLEILEDLLGRAEAFLFPLR